MSLRRAVAVLTLVLRAALAVSISTTISGCFQIDLGKILKAAKKKKQKKTKTSTSSGDDDDDDDAEPATELGEAEYPPGTKKPVADLDWYADKLEPHRYKVEYAMSREMQDQVLGAHKEFSKKVGFTPMGEGRFRWFIPPGCEPDMGCVFGAMSDANRDALAPVVERFRLRQKSANLDAGQLASLVVTFAQSIHYEEPDDQPFGILPPASVIAEKRGDCDSKSLLTHLILRELGIDSVMLSSKAHRHAMLGIAIPATGHTFKFGGRQYAYTELTAKNSPIGHINPELLQPDDWAIVPTRWPSSSWSGGPH